jgi:glycosyltransferase involved in cell wall biosynthesis
MLSPIRVLVVFSSEDDGGLVRVATDVALGLPAHGFETAIVMQRPSAAGARLSAAGMALHIVPELLETLDRTPDGRRSAAAIPRNLLKLASAARRIREAARQLGAQVIYSHGSWPNHLSAEATRGAAIPVVWHVHSAFSRANHVAARVAARRGRLARVIAVSRATARPYEPLAPVTIVYNGVDLGACGAASREPRLRAALDIPAGAFVFGYAGRLVAHKGTAVAAAAAADVLASTPDAYFVVLGANPASGTRDVLGDMRAVLTARGVADRCRFPGYISEPLAFIAGFDASLVPSTYEDPCPLAVIEALALGVPVIGSRAGGIPELVDDGETGVLVPPGDAHALAAAMRDLYAGRAQLSRMRSAARDAAVARFDRARVVAEVADVLRRAARNAPPE